LLPSIVAGLLACGEAKVVCPPGYRVEGTFCYPQDEPAADSVSDPGTRADTGSGQDADTVLEAAPVADTQPIDTKQETEVAGEIKTEVKAETKPGGKNVIGQTCADELECVAGLACFNWPKGYCTLVDCNAAGNVCPGSAVCWSPGSGPQLCAEACDLDSDCRTVDGYACKRLTQAFGAVDARLCLPGGKSPAGFNCTKPLDCSGSATCLTDMAGGYCARVGCSATDVCDAGTACVLRAGKPMCLKTCKGDSECQIPTKQPRKCVDRTDLSKKAVKVCLDSATLAPVGAPCVADGDCESKVCTLYAKGTCKADQAPCLSDDQCGAGGPCQLAAAAEKGTCTSPCSTEKACPTGGLCIPGSADGFSGSCGAKCQGPGDEKSCGGVPGLECFYGQPLPSPMAPAVPGYACALRPKGAPGAFCQQDGDCGSGKCFSNSLKSAGYCAGKCGAGQKSCPFGTACIDTGISYCLRMCSGDYDCPDMMTCQNAQGTKACLQP
jgi:hypothetical protein